MNTHNLTQKQRNLLSEIVAQPINPDVAKSYHARTINSLIDRGLIVWVGEPGVGHLGFTVNGEWAIVHKNLLGLTPGHLSLYSERFTSRNSDEPFGHDTETDASDTETDANDTETDADGSSSLARGGNTVVRRSAGSRRRRINLLLKRLDTWSSSYRFWSENEGSLSEEGIARAEEQLVYVASLLADCISDKPDGYHGW